LGVVKIDLSFDPFGTDRSTSIHRLSVWAELGMFCAGWTYSDFMDIAVFQSTIDYRGPSGMEFARNPQLRITPWAWDGHCRPAGGAARPRIPASRPRSRKSSAPASLAGTGCPT
jgi:hypothetical protein